MYSKQDKDGRITIAASLNPDITGHGSDGKHTTFFTSEGRGFRTRSISEKQAGWFILIPGIILAMSAYLSWAFSSENPEHLSRAIILFGVLGVTILAVSLREGGCALKELFMLAAAGEICRRPFSLRDEEVVLALIVIAVAFVWHLVWWIRYAVWEPFACTVLFYGWLFVCRFGSVPEYVEGPLFAFIGIASFCWACAISMSAELYRRGFANLREY